MLTEKDLSQLALAGITIIKPITRKPVSLKVDILDEQGRIADTYHLGKPLESQDFGSAVRFRTAAPEPTFVL